MKFTDYRLAEKALQRLAKEYGLHGHPYARHPPRVLSFDQEMACISLYLDLTEDVRRLPAKPVRRMIRSLVFTSFQEN